MSRRLAVHRAVGSDMKLVKQGDETYFGRNKVALLHFEFTSRCNQQCSYCLEGNGDPGKEPAPPSDEAAMLRSIEKIFRTVGDDDHLGFILVGGEPTIQPAFPAVVAKIRSRKRTNILLTTNLRKPAVYYEDLDVPIVASMHFDSVDPDDYLRKVLDLSRLVAHVRIMAHPRKMDLVRKTYRQFLDAAKEHPINFAVEEILPFGSYRPDYMPEDLESLRQMPRQDCVYPGELQEKLGIFINLFGHQHWFFEDEGTLVRRTEGPDDFESFYCERNLLIVRADGDLLLGYGCGAPGCNIFEVPELPQDIFSTVICDRKVCGKNFGFTYLLPKFRHARYAPEYVRTSHLCSLRLGYVVRKALRGK
jgi:organic radical activating enzyme